MVSFVLFVGLMVCGYIVYAQCRTKEAAPYQRRPVVPAAPPRPPVVEIDEPPLHYRFKAEPINMAIEPVTPPQAVPVPKPVVVRHTPRHPKPRRHD